MHPIYFLVINCQNPLPVIQFLYLITEKTGAQIVKQWMISVFPIYFLICPTFSLHSFPSSWWHVQTQKWVHGSDWPIRLYISQDIGLAQRWKYDTNSQLESFSGIGMDLGKEDFTSLTLDYYLWGILNSIFKNTVTCFWFFNDRKKYLRLSEKVQFILPIPCYCI